jgi:parvulin-like peptidyl-prolyl isomerase
MIRRTLAALILLSSLEIIGPGPGHLQARDLAPAVPQSGSVAARVNGIAILDSQVDERFRLLLRKRSKTPSELTPEEMQSLRRQCLDQLVDETLLDQASKAKSITVTEKAVDGQVQELEAHFSSHDEFVASLKEEGISEESLRETIRRNLSVQELLQQHLDRSVSVSEQEIGDYYRKNQDKLRRPESAHVLEIFLRVDSRMDPSMKAKTRGVMESVLASLRSGKDFSEMAREFSEGPSASQGGDLGWLTRNEERPLLLAEAMKLKPGEISDILESSAGLHIIKVVDQKPAEDVSLEEAKSRIESILRQQKQQAALKGYLADLRAGAKIEFPAATP